MPAAAATVNLVDLYLRLSISADGADSLDRQETDLRKWAANEGLEVRKVWRDDGRSGYRRGVKREGFDAALKAIVDGEAKTLAVWKLDRLSRQGAGQVGVFLDDVERAGGRLVFLKDGLDTRTGNAARMPIMVLSEIARSESVNTSLRVKSRKDRNRADGRYLGGPPPYGYEVDEERHFRPKEPEYSVMRDVVSRIVGGETLLAIVRDLNERRVPTRRGGAWRVNTLSWALRSPTLVGLTPEKQRGEDGTWKSQTRAWRNQNGDTVSLMAPGCEAIATEGEQARMLTIMDERLRRYGRGKVPVRQPRSLLGGLVRCASCGRTMNTFGGSYRCRRWMAGGQEGDCPRPVSVKEEVLEEAVVRAWVARLAALDDDPDSTLLHAVADRWLKRYDPAPLQERASLAGRVEEAEARLSRADDDHYVKGTLDEGRHSRITAALADTLADLRGRLSALPAPEADLGGLLDPELSRPAFDESSVHEKRELLRLALVRVTVTPAPKRGARFDPVTRLSFGWIGDEGDDG
ncbi:recombinase family protein [Nocardioides panacisoli]|uniref:recombinase family protein n=1 Tax=Nocardioides panacisoli TaxID=627624 RepID=UPI001C63B2FC|nr:recombinase family protein [Nocardioides panacisoli]QYJ04233.1 recombinase family protein [Nocardioides panacisoli]